MEIVEAVIEWALPQVDGSFVVRELLTDNEGNKYGFDYSADKNLDREEHLNERIYITNSEFQYQEDNADIFAQQKVDEIKSTIADLQDQLQDAVAAVAEVSSGRISQ